MKKWIVVLLSITTIILLNACSLNESYSDEEIDTNTTIATEESALTTQSKDEMLIVTKYYTLSVPCSWNDDCYFEVVGGESYNYTLSFYDKANRNSANKGQLFSIHLLTTYEDYSVYPKHDVLGSLEVYRIGLYNIVITYPTDIQSSETTVEKYNLMADKIPEILKTISFKDECTFSEAPIPLDSSVSSQGSLSAKFHDELYKYTVSTCVEQTEWWDSPNLFYANPTLYYIGAITPENYFGKMTEAKKFVNGIYKTKEIRISEYGKKYGTIFIGLHTSSTGELYLCCK